MAHITLASWAAMLAGMAAHIIIALLCKYVNSPGMTAQKSHFAQFIAEKYLHKYVRQKKIVRLAPRGTRGSEKRSVKLWYIVDLCQNVTPPVPKCHTPCAKMSHPLCQFSAQLTNISFI